MPRTAGNTRHPYLVTIISSPAPRHSLIKGVSMASSDRLRVGFIGAAGRWGPSAHAPALQKVPEVEMHAVCTAHADTAQAAADQYGVKKAYSSVRAMGADPQVDAALVAVRVPAHY